MVCYFPFQPYHSYPRCGIVYYGYCMYLFHHYLLQLSVVHRLFLWAATINPHNLEWYSSYIRTEWHFFSRLQRSHFCFLTHPTICQILFHMFVQPLDVIHLLYSFCKMRLSQMNQVCVEPINWIFCHTCRNIKQICSTPFVFSRQLESNATVKLTFATSFGILFFPGFKFTFVLLMFCNISQIDRHVYLIFINNVPDRVH